MPGQTTRWLDGSAALERRHGRELETIEQVTELAEARVRGVNQVTASCVRDHADHTVRAQAEQIAPDGAQLYAMLTVAGAVAPAEVIQGMNRRRCGR